jgi:hypothetical protein
MRRRIIDDEVLLTEQNDIMMIPHTRQQGGDATIIKP